MPLTREDLVDAMQAYWGRKALQMENASIAGAVGAGTAGSVRGGKQFDPIAAILAKPFFESGYSAHDIRVSGGGMTLPGYFRPTKNWDVVVGRSGVVAPDPTWDLMSYQQRFARSLARMQDLGIYDAVCLLVSDREHPDPREPSASLDWKHFTASISARIHYLHELGIPD